MEISWYGHACFHLKHKDMSIVTDPYDDSLGLTMPRLKADIVTVSHTHPHHDVVNRVQGTFRKVDGPGEYEIGGVFITGATMYTMDDQRGQDQGDLNWQNVVYVYHMDGLKVCHLGDLHHIPTQSQVEALGDVDVLLVPVGGGRTLKAAKAAEVISLIEPALAIPMHYELPGLSLELDTLDKFLKEMGLGSLDPLRSLKLSKSNLPEETQVVVLACSATWQSQTRPQTAFKDENDRIA
jgi:L-ascorbate metabolism protein UlaG (beta-lactamase superfamily)